MSYCGRLDRGILLVSQVGEGPALTEGKHMTVVIDEVRIVETIEETISTLKQMQQALTSNDWAGLSEMAADLSNTWDEISYDADVRDTVTA